MFEPFKKTLVAGLSVMLLTKEKAEALVEELVEQGRISQQEAEEIVEELMAKTEKEGQEAKSKMKDSFDNFLNKAGFKKDEDKEDALGRLQDQMRMIQLELAALKKEVEELQNKE